ELVVRQALEQPPRRSHLVIVVSEQAVFDRHTRSLEREARPSHREKFTLAARALLACAAITIVACHREPPRPPPLVAQLSGTIDAAVSAPVRIVRDRWGVP